MKITVQQDIPKTICETWNERRSIANKLLKDIYKRKDSYFKVEDDEGKYKNVASFLKYLKEESEMVSYLALKEKGVDTRKLRLALTYDEKINAFTIRKEKCGKGVYIRIVRFTDDDIAKFNERVETYEQRKKERELNRTISKQKVK